MKQLTTQSVLTRCYLAFFLSGMGSLMVGSLLPYLRQSYAINYQFAGMMLSAQPVGNMLATLLAGVLPLYFGRKNSVLLLTIWMPIAYLLFTSASLPVLLLAACFCTGLARGGGSNFSNVVVSTLASENARGLNLLHAAFALGALLAPFLLLFTGMLFGQAGFRVATGIMTILALLQFSFYHASASQNSLSAHKHGGLQQADYRFLRSPVFWRAGFTLLFYLSAEYAITGWLVTYMKDSGIFSQTLAQMTSSLLWVMILLGRLAVAALSKQLSRSTLLCFGGIGFFAFFCVVFTSTAALQAAIGIIGLGFCMAGIYPTTFSSVSAELADNDLAASALMVMGSLGGIAAPALIGVISERAGIISGMRTVVILTALTLLLLLVHAYFLRRPQNSV